MKLRIKKSDIVNLIKCMPIVLLCTLASIALLLPPWVLFSVVLLFGIFLMGTYLENGISRDIKGIWVVFMLFFYIWNNPYLSYISYTNIQVFLCFPISILFAVHGGYSKKKWLQILFDALRIVYMFYSLFTIAMFINPNLITFVCHLFPDYQSTLMQQFNSGGLPGLTHHYSTNGMLLSIGALIFGSYALCRGKKIDKLLFFISVFALLLTGKRAHIIFGMSALYICYYIYNVDKRKGRVYKSIGILLAAVCVFVIANYFIPSLSTFIVRFIDTAETGDATLGRTTVWATALKQVQNHFWLGIGWEQYTRQGGWTWNIHNIYIQLLVETGVLGLITYIAWFVFFICRTCKTYTYMRVNKTLYSVSDVCFINFSMAMQILFLLYGFTGNPLYDKEMFVPYFLACAISQKYSKMRLNEVRDI